MLFYGLWNTRCVGVINRGTGKYTFFRRRFAIHSVLLNYLQFVFQRGPHDVGSFFLRVPYRSLYFEPQLVTSLSSKGGTSHIQIFVRVFRDLVRAVFGGQAQAILSRLYTGCSGVIRPLTSVHIRLTSRATLCSAGRGRSSASGRSYGSFCQVQGLFPRFRMRKGSGRGRRSPSAGPCGRGDYTKANHVGRCHVGRTRSYGRWACPGCRRVLFRFSVPFRSTGAKCRDRFPIRPIMYFTSPSQWCRCVYPISATKWSSRSLQRTPMIQR